jgi:hypothetical protein
MRMRGRTGRIVIAALLALLCCAPAARADWSGDAKADVLAIDPNSGALLMYKGTGGGAFDGGGVQIGSGWASFTALLSTEFSGDGKQDLLARGSDGTLYLYRGNGRGGFLTGAGESLGGGWQNFTAIVAPGDWSGDSHPDLIALSSDGTLYLYRGNGESGFIGGGIPIAAGWQNYNALLAPGDWSGDGKPDLLVRSATDGSLQMFRGNGHGSFVTGGGQRVGTGWGGFTALTARGDFSGDGYPDVLARAADGGLFMYRGNGETGFIAPYPQVGSGWQSLSFITLIGQGPHQLAPTPPAPATTPVGEGRVHLSAGDHCVPPGGRLHVSLKIKKRKGHKRPRVVKVVFFVRHGPRKTDRKKPYEVRLRLRRPAGQKGRVYARVFFKRSGTKKLRHKTVARRYVMCG